MLVGLGEVYNLMLTEPTTARLEAWGSGLGVVTERDTAQN